MYDKHCFLYALIQLCLIEIQDVTFQFYFKLSFQELYGDCDKLRQTVFQLATETEDNDSNLGKKYWN